MAKRRITEKKQQKPTKNLTTETYRDLFRVREQLRCQGKSALCATKVTNHDKHMARELPDDYSSPCVVKQCNPRHMQSRQSENMGLADPHYVAEQTRVKRHSMRRGDPTLCCHGDDYDTDSENEEDDDIQVNRVYTWVQRHTTDIIPYIPALGALFVLWLFVMNYAIYGKGPASTDR